MLSDPFFITKNREITFEFLTAAAAKGARSPA
jgi:hypothetical protein